ncbi:MAG: hypothetical protein Q9226_006854 [Calogaya cf. arnoldii]
MILTSARYDTAGPMGKTVEDVADLLNVLVDHSTTEVPEGDYASAMTRSWDDVKVGTLDPEKWKMDDAFRLVADLKADMDNYLGKLEQSKVKSLEELVEWNKAHAKKGLTDGTFAFLYNIGSHQDWLTFSMTEYPNQILLEQGLEFGDSIEARESKHTPKQSQPKSTN